MAWTLLSTTLQIFQILILIRVVLSWVASPVSRNPLIELIRRSTDPILEPIRRVVPDMGGIDLSPIVALLLLSLLQRMVAGMAYSGAW